MTECDSYTWNGTTYSSMYTWAGTKAWDDSVHVLSLTINQSNLGSSNAFACTFTWDGVADTKWKLYKCLY